MSRTVYVYIIKEVQTRKTGKSKLGAVKIGLARNVSQRLETLQTGNPRTLELVMSIPFKSRHHAKKAEEKLHRMYKYQRIRGEWFTGDINLARIQYARIEVDEKEPETPDNVVQMDNHFRSI